MLDEALHRRMSMAAIPAANPTTLNSFATKPKLDHASFTGSHDPAPGPPRSRMIPVWRLLKPSRSIFLSAKSSSYKVLVGAGTTN